MVKAVIHEILLMYWTSRIVLLIKL